MLEDRPAPSQHQCGKRPGIPTIAFGAAQLGLGIASFFTAPARP
ncbi:MAG: hypothetical protein Q8L14_41795 [Myxococcales bacterium]|nr:hypothetical protein [Myxococcales bacterium]